MDSRPIPVPQRQIRGILSFLVSGRFSNKSYGSNTEGMRGIITVKKQSIKTQGISDCVDSYFYRVRRKEDRRYCSVIMHHHLHHHHHHHRHRHRYRPCHHFYLVNTHA